MPRVLTPLVANIVPGAKGLGVADRTSGLAFSNRTVRFGGNAAPTTAGNVFTIKEDGTAEFLAPTAAPAQSLRLPNLTVLNLSGGAGSPGDVLTKQEDGSLALQAPPTGGTGAARAAVVVNALTMDDLGGGAGTNYLQGAANGALDATVLWPAAVPAAGQVVMVRAQDTPTQNGLYTVVRPGGAAETWRLERLANWEVGDAVGAADFMLMVENGVAPSLWSVQNTGGSADVTIGADSLIFRRMAGPDIIYEVTDANPDATALVASGAFVAETTLLFKLSYGNRGGAVLPPSTTYHRAGMTVRARSLGTGMAFLITQDGETIEGAGGTGMFGSGGTYVFTGPGDAVVLRADGAGDWTILEETEMRQPYGIVSVESGGLDPSKGHVFDVPLRIGVQTIANPLWPGVDGQVIYVRINQDTGGPYQPTWGDAWSFPGGVAPVLQGTYPGDNIDILPFIYNMIEQKWHYVGSAGGGGGSSSGGAVTTVSAAAGEAIAAGAMVSLQGVGGVLKAYNAKATGLIYAADGYATTAASMGQIFTVGIGQGSLITGFSGLTQGAVYFLSTTPGQITTTPPSTSGNIVQRVGKAMSATSLKYLEGEPIVLA